MNSNKRLKQIDILTNVSIKEFDEELEKAGVNKDLLVPSIYVKNSGEVYMNLFTLCKSCEVLRGEKLKNEQLSFLTTKEIIIIRNKYDATICYRCCCNRCKYNVEIYPCLTTEECKDICKDSCFNCDECFYYGMDNEELSTNRVKFKCDKFEMSNYYKELKVKKRRKSFKII